MEKWPFFDQNHGLTPLEKSQFFDFLNFFFLQVRKMRFTIFQNEKTIFYAIKTGTSKNPKIEIFPKALTHGFGGKKFSFFNFFLGNMGQESGFYDILERKTFLAIKTTSSKSRKIEIFPKRLTLGFGHATTKKRYCKP